jgi:butyryl-CoA dehydrogenase
MNDGIYILGAARALVYRAAALKDADRPTTEAAAAAKLAASELAVHAANVAMQVHGGYGYMEESAIPRFYRDAKILTIGEGTSEILKLVIARQMGLSV